MRKVTCDTCEGYITPERSLSKSVPARSFCSTECQDFARCRIEPIEETRKRWRYKVRGEKALDKFIYSRSEVAS